MNWRRAGIGVGVAGVLGVAGLLGAIFYAPLYSLMPHQPSDTTALLGNRTAIVAHRGASSVAPENTLAAFRAAAAAGLFIELDVTLCATGEVIVIHDDSVDRTTEGTGRVAELDLPALRRLDAGSWFAPSFRDEKLPLLDEVLTVTGPETVIDIELKTGDDKVALPRAVVDVIRRNKASERVFVTSFDPYMLEQLRLLAPEIPRGQLVGTYADSDLAWYEKRALQNLVFAGSVQPDLLVYEYVLLSQGLVDRLHGYGYRVFAWTVDAPEDLERMKAMGVDGVISNHPERAQAIWR